MKISTKREFGEKRGRCGLSERILFLAKKIVENGSYKYAIENAGRISVLVEAATFDEYWKEKSDIGKWKEECFIEQELKKDSSRTNTPTKP